MISSYPTDTFNPTLTIHITDGDYYDFTLKECIEKLVICDDCIIFRKNLDAFIAKHGNRFEMLECNLYNLLNAEHCVDAPQEYWDWFDRILRSRRVKEDEEEEEEEEEEATCVVCNETKTEDWAWNTTAVKNAPVCGDCLETLEDAIDYSKLNYVKTTPGGIKIYH